MCSWRQNLVSWRWDFSQISPVKMIFGLFYEDDNFSQIESYEDEIWANEDNKFSQRINKSHEGANISWGCSSKHRRCTAQCQYREIAQHIPPTSIHSVCYVEHKCNSYAQVYVSTEPAIFFFHPGSWGQSKLTHPSVCSAHNFLQQEREGSSLVD